MANSLYVYWAQLQVPAASTTTFSKSGGFASSRSVGAGTGDKAFPVSGGIQSKIYAAAGLYHPPVGADAPWLLFVSKNVGIVSPRISGANKNTIAQKASGIASPRSSGSAKTVIISKSGGFTNRRLIGDTKPSRIFVYWAQLVVPGTTSSTFAKAGGIKSSQSTGGDHGFIPIYSKNGGFTSPRSTGSTKSSSLLGAWSATHTFSVVAQPQKTGGITTPLSTSGVKAEQAVKTGGIVQPKKPGASKAVVISKTGGMASARSTGGIGLLITTIIKSGGMATAYSTGAPPTTHLIAKTGSIASARSTSASKAFNASKSGGLVETGMLSADVFVSSTTVKVGIIRSRRFTSATKNITFTKTGGINTKSIVNDLSFRRSGGNKTRSTLGPITKLVIISKSGGFSSSFVSQADKNWTASKTSGITKRNLTGASGNFAWPKAGGIKSQSLFGGSQHVPVRFIPVFGGISSSKKLGASGTFHFVFSRSGGLSFALVTHERPTVSYKTKSRLGGTVHYKRIVIHGRHSVLSAKIESGQILTADEQTILVGI